MTDPKSSGYYKATINEDSLFAYFDTFYGWMTYSEPTEWRPIHMEFTGINFIKY